MPAKHAHAHAHARPSPPHLCTRWQVVYAEEHEWAPLVAKFVAEGVITEPAFMQGLQKRMESTVLGLQSGSYAQRVQVGVAHLAGVMPCCVPCCARHHPSHLAVHFMTPAAARDAGCRPST